MKLVGLGVPNSGHIHPWNHARSWITLTQKPQKQLSKQTLKRSTAYHKRAWQSVGWCQGVVDLKSKTGQLYVCVYIKVYMKDHQSISTCSFLNATSFIWVWPYGSKKWDRSFRGDPDAWNEWVTYSRTCWEGILSWPGKVQLVILGYGSRVWIISLEMYMGMHRGYGPHVGPGYGSEPYILSHGQYQSYHSQRLSPRRDAPSGSKIHQSPLKHWGTLPTGATWAVVYSLGLGCSPCCSIHWKENGETSNSTWCYKWKTLPH